MNLYKRSVIAETVILQLCKQKLSCANSITLYLNRASALFNLEPCNDSRDHVKCLFNYAQVRATQLKELF